MKGCEILMSDQISRKQKREIQMKAIRDGGFYGTNGVWNSIITFPGDKTVYRERVETIIVRDGKEVFLKKKPNGDYFLPGGSTEKNLTHMEQAINECREEARINVRKIESTGLTYKEYHKTPEWAKKMCHVEWNGTYTEIYIAEYDSMYKGKIEEVDKDPFILSGKFYPTKECFKIFRKEHREALLWYLKNYNMKEENTITESYISNYFKNKKLLKRISNKPELTKELIEQAIVILKKEYGNLSSKSKIQREKKSKDVANIFHPILTLEFNDGCTIAIAICFDESSFTDGVAINTDEYGNIVVVYPGFFKAKKEDQIFTLLHEIGHVRLEHLTYKNISRNIFGDDKTNELRIKRMSQGKCIYPEINADLYAVLNGASMYTILNASIRQDSDESYDYRFTNAELANRYTNVFKRYNSLRKYNEDTNSVESYDIACLALYEMVYENPKLKDTSSENKNKLYNLLYETCIHDLIKEDKEVKETDWYYKTVKENKSDSDVIYEAYLNRVTSHANAYNNIKKEKTNVECPNNIHKKMVNMINEKTTYRNKFEETLENIYDKFKYNYTLYEYCDKKPSQASENIFNLLKLYYE